MTEGSHLKDILDSLTDTDSVNQFASIHGLTGHPEVENRLKDLWENRIDLLWREVLEMIEDDPHLKRQKLKEQPSTNDVQHGGGQSMKSMTNKLQEQPSTSTVQQVESGQTISEGEKPYYIWKKDSRTFMKNTATETTFKLKFNEQWTGEKLVDIYDKLHDMFNDVLGDDSDLGRVVIQHPKLNNAIVVSLRKWEDLNADTVMSEVTKVLNSNEDVPVDGDLIVTIGSIDMPKGWGGNKLPITSLIGSRNSLMRKNSILEVQNDNNCYWALLFKNIFKKSILIHGVL